MTKHKFYEGQRVRLTRDLPDNVSRTSHFNLYCGETGTIAQIQGQFGFKSDRFGEDTVFISRTVLGKVVYIVDFCVPIDPHTANTQKLPVFKEGQGA